jgi:hypothetical protein
VKALAARGGAIQPISVVGSLADLQIGAPRLSAQADECPRLGSRACSSISRLPEPV